MPNLLEFAGNILRDAGYTVTRSDEGRRSLQFEDEAVLGILRSFDQVKDLLTSWEAEQDSFLKNAAKALRSEPAKAWNAYTVVISSEVCPIHLRSQLEAVEEDFRGTRKIAQAGIEILDDVERALLPLLPLQSVAVLRLEDPIQRLRTRLHDVPLRVVDGLVNGVAPLTLAGWLLEES